jgi:hypothetical protein
MDGHNAYLYPISIATVFDKFVSRIECPEWSWAYAARFLWDSDGSHLLYFITDDFCSAVAEALHLVSTEDMSACLGGDRQGKRRWTARRRKIQNTVILVANVRGLPWLFCFVTSMFVNLILFPSSCSSQRGAIRSWLPISLPLYDIYPIHFGKPNVQSCVQSHIGSAG